MKRLRTHGLIKKIAETYKYYLTALQKLMGQVPLLEGVVS